MKVDRVHFATNVWFDAQHKANFALGEGLSIDVDTGKGMVTLSRTRSGKKVVSMIPMTNVSTLVLTPETAVAEAPPAPKPSERETVETEAVKPLVSKIVEVAGAFIPTPVSRGTKTKK